MNIKPLVMAGMVLGIGLGGFFDGIVFHQLLQVHNMLTARYPNTSVGNMELNMFWDGIFHALTYLATLAGLGLLWRAGRRRPEVPWNGKILIGAMLAGWGAFNFVEGILDHHLLHLHHVVERYGLSVYDYGFLASGIVLMVGGCLLIRAARASL